MAVSSKPTIVRLPATAPFEEICQVIRRDGGVIIENFLSPEEVASFNETSTPLFEKRMALGPQQALTEMGPEFHASNTTHIRGLLGTMPEQTVKVMQHPLWGPIMHEFLKTETRTMVGNHELVTKTSYILSLAVGFHVASGANDQILHRDQSIHSVRAEENSLYTSDVGCLIAGTRSTVRNGATRVIPGSHLWPWDRAPTTEEAVHAEMEPGSALFWLGSTYHGASENVTSPGDEDAVRILYGFFGCQDYLRAEECQQMVVPPEVARKLPVDVLRKAGWAKGAGGSGFINAKDPMVELGYVKA